MHTDREAPQPHRRDTLRHPWISSPLLRRILLLVAGVVAAVTGGTGWLIWRLYGLSPALWTGGLLCGALMLFTIVVTRWVDRDIYAAQKALKEEQKQFRLVFENALSAISIREIVPDDRGEPVDYIFLHGNRAFQRYTGLDREEINGKRATEVMPGIEETPFLSRYIEMMRSGEPTVFEQYSTILHRHYYITAYPLEGRRFTVIFSDITEQREAERQQRLLMTLLQHTDSIAVFKDPALRYLMANDAYLAMTGRDSVDEIAGRTDRELFGDLATEEQIAEYMGNDREALALPRGERIQTEERLPGEEGERTFLTKKFPVYNDGELLGVGSLSTEITERKRMEEELSARIEAMETSQDGMAILNRKGRYIYLNEAHARIYGYSTSDELMGKSWKMLYSDGELQRFEEEIMPHFRKEGQWRGEAVGTRADGSSFPQEVSLAVLESGGLICVVRDTTERKRAEEKLRESNMILHSIIDALPGTLAVMDRGYKLLAMNTYRPRIDYVGARNPEELLGKKCYQLFHGRSSPCPWCHTPAVLETGEPVTDVTTPDDPREQISGRAMQQTVTPMKDEEGHITGVVEYGVDVTELRNAREKAEAATRAKSAFLATMSHEIRTPLNGVIGMTSLLLDTPLSGEQREYAEVIRSSGEALLHLVNDILDLTRIEAGKLSLDILPFALRALLHDLERTMAFQAGEKGLRLAVGFDPAVPTRLRGDPGRLRQILTNLLSNAVKFTDEGEITVNVTVQERKAHQIALRFSVRDTGIGIAEDKLDRLFDHFTQADSSTTRRFGGSGLGLTIAKELTEMMGGEIGVESKEEVGSEFWFTAFFDLQDTESGESGSLQTGEPALQEWSTSNAAGFFSDRSVRVLVAEDTPTNQRVALKLLGKLGVAADAVGNGIEALEALESILYDLVLMDVEMPEMDGFEATRAIRASSSVRRPQVPVIAMTAYATDQDREECLTAGMNGFISKPVTTGALAEVLQAWLPEMGAADATAAPPPDRGKREQKQPPASGDGCFDREGFLEQFPDDETSAREIIEAFLADAPHQVALLRRGWEEGDIQSARSQGHKLKSLIALLGSPALQADLTAVREAVKSGEDDAATGEALERFESHFRRLQAELRDYLEENAT